jgi:hypothetical protein
MINNVAVNQGHQLPSAGAISATPPRKAPLSFPAERNLAFFFIITTTSLIADNPRVETTSGSNFSHE